MIATLRVIMNYTMKVAGILFIGLIRAYQMALSPLMAQRCRFYPSCSSYAIEAVQRHGPTRGIYLAARRLLKCQPFHSGGFDPVP